MLSHGTHFKNAFEDVKLVKYKDNHVLRKCFNREEKEKDRFGQY